mgnify:CR=1 FL=1
MRTTGAASRGPGVTGAGGGGGGAGTCTAKAAGAIGAGAWGGGAGDPDGALTPGATAQAGATAVREVLFDDRPRPIMSGHPSYASGVSRATRRLYRIATTILEERANWQKIVKMRTVTPVGIRGSV